MKSIFILALLCATFCANAQCPTISVNLSAFPNYPMSGQEVRTIYLNYPSSQQTTDINVSASGGTEPYSYTWGISGCNASTTGTLSNGGATYTWQPTSADICSGNGDNVYVFTVTATDANGCSGNASIKANVVDAYVGSNVQVCHKIAMRGGSSTQLLTVTPSQVVTHLAHGDYLGNCTVFTGN